MLQEINGVSVDVIHRRSQPLVDKTQFGILSIEACLLTECRDPTSWKFRSWTGFLGPNENINEVIQQDTETVQLLGTTHQALSGHLKQVISFAKVSSVLPACLCLPLT